jgi:hypothetical protein
LHQLLFNMMTALMFDDDSRLETDAQEVETPPEAVIKSKAGNVVSWKKNVLKSTKAPYNSIVGLGSMIACDGLLERGREALLLELEELPMFLLMMTASQSGAPSLKGQMRSQPNARFCAIGS